MMLVMKATQHYLSKDNKLGDNQIMDECILLYKCLLWNFRIYMYYINGSRIFTMQWNVSFVDNYQFIIFAIACLL